MVNTIEEKRKTGAVTSALPDSTLPAMGLIGVGVGVAVVASFITSITNYKRNKQKSDLRFAREQAMNISMQAKAQRIQASTGLSIKEVTDSILAKHNLKLRK